MLNQLNSILDYLKDNLVLVIVLAVIVALIIGVVVAMIVIAAKAKKRQAAQTEEPVSPAEPAPAEPAEPAAPAEEAPAKRVTPDEKPAPAPVEEPAPAPAEEEPKNAEPKKAKQPAKEEPKKTEPQKSTTVTGKWIIRKQDDKYAFDLVASNGEVMITSSVPYSSLSSAKSGIQTYKNNIAAGKFTVTETKNGDFIFQLLNARGALLANGNAYRTRANCENAIESTKRWALSDIIEVRD